MPSEGINELSTIAFSVSTSGLSAEDQITAAWLIEQKNARIQERNAVIEAENEGRAAADPPLEPLPLIPEITTIDEYLVNVLTRAWRLGGGSYMNQRFNHETAISNQTADAGRRLDANEVLAGRSAASPTRARARDARE